MIIGNVKGKTGLTTQMKVWNPSLPALRSPSIRWDWCLRNVFNIQELYKNLYVLHQKLLSFKKIPENDPTPTSSLFARAPLIGVGPSAIILTKQEHHYPSTVMGNSA
jgi:hypothetical protein